MLKQLWSISTTIREAERILGFLKTALEIDGMDWSPETQIKFQILLIKNRQVLNNDKKQTFNKLNEQQISLLRDKSRQMSYIDAKEIFETKKYEAPPMRGRQSLSPLRKLGLVFIKDERVSVTDVGRKLARGDISFDDFMLDSLLKFQYPNPFEENYKDWDTKPFINTLKLIKKVNELCLNLNMKAKGISRVEFGIFGLSLKSYKEVDSTAQKILDFRLKYESIKDYKERELFKNEYIDEYLTEFKNPRKNVKEYTDNMIRYLRITKYIYIRGKYDNIYIDLEPRRIEINSILNNDNGSSKLYTEEEWISYMGTYGTYTLPFETIPELKRILYKIKEEIVSIEKNLNIAHTFHIPIIEDRNYLKSKIKESREYRTHLQNLSIKQQYHSDFRKIDEVIEALHNIVNRNKSSLTKKLSIELEKWTNIALNIINDSELILPKAPVGDDNEPTYTAPSDVADIECYYKEFNAICEVTMLTSRDQWYNEGQPVMRHLRDFENKHPSKNSYCLFIAPSLHVDTLNTFYTSVKYEYNGRPQKIVPITINQLVLILQTIKEAKLYNKQITHLDVKKLYDQCINMVSVSNITIWTNNINENLQSLSKSMIS